MLDAARLLLEACWPATFGAKLLVAREKWGATSAQTVALLSLCPETPPLLHHFPQRPPSHPPLTPLRLGGTGAGRGRVGVGPQGKRPSRSRALRQSAGVALGGGGQARVEQELG